MGSLPRPLLAVLVAVIAVFAAWTFVLKPKSSSSSGGASPQAVHQALSTAVGSTGSAKHTTTSKSASTESASRTASARPAAPAGPSHVSPAQRRVNEVTSALESGKVLALVIDTKHRAQMLIGFADQLEYNQLVAGALKTK